MFTKVTHTDQLMIVRLHLHHHPGATATTTTTTTTTKNKCSLLSILAQKAKANYDQGALMAELSTHQTTS